MDRAPPQLTPRQAQVLHLVVQGLSSGEIASRLGLSRRTVDNHRAQICRRLGLRGSHALLRAHLDGPEAGPGFKGRPAPE